MCVIAIKTRGQKMLPKHILDKMRKANNDGFGFVSESLYYRTMNYDAFLQMLKLVPQEENCIIHFRWATHGSLKRENCHPFHENGIYFAHNGILPISSINDKTDSEICFHRDIMPMVRKYGFDACHRHIESLRHTSKFAFMVNGEIHLFGTYEKYAGYSFSNLRFIGYYGPILKNTFKRI